MGQPKKKILVLQILSIISYSGMKTVSGTEVPISHADHCDRKKCSQPLPLVIRTVVSVRPECVVPLSSLNFPLHMMMGTGSVPKTLYS